jgi:hypothetical protein
VLKFVVESESRSPSEFTFELAMFSVPLSTFSGRKVGSLMGILADGALSARGKMTDAGGICIASFCGSIGEARHGGLYCGTRAENVFVGVVGEVIAGEVKGLMVVVG